MKLLKVLVAFTMSIGMTMCHPVMADAPGTPKEKFVLEMCRTAAVATTKTIENLKAGTSSLEVMVKLDGETPSRDSQPAKYLGYAYAKLNIDLVRTALKKAFTEQAIQKTQMENCLKSNNTLITVDKE